MMRPFNRSLVEERKKNQKYQKNRRREKSEGGGTKNRDNQGKRTFQGKKRKRVGRGELKRTSDWVEGGGV